MKHIHTSAELSNWLSESRPGDRCSYFEGFLGQVREWLQRAKYESPFEDSLEVERNRINRETLELVNKARQVGTPSSLEIYKTTGGKGVRGLGLAHMYSQRLGEGHYLYILERR